MTAGRVLVVGDLVTDVVAALPGPPAQGSDTPARIRITGGGQAANTAAWLARQGRATTLVAAVGDDRAGRQRLAELDGVDLAVREVAGVATGTVVALSYLGTRTMITDRGAAAHLRPADVGTALVRFRDVRHVHVSGYLLLAEETRAVGRHALAIARDRGMTSSVGAASAAPLRAAGGRAFLDWVSGTELLLANDEEATVLQEAGARRLRAAAGAVVITHGDAGAHWQGTDGRAARAEPVRATSVDPTGAGDAFTAGLLHAWLAGADPASALAAGARLGAEAVQRLGARPQHPPPGQPLATPPSSGSPPARAAGASASPTRCTSIADS